MKEEPETPKKTAIPGLKPQITRFKAIEGISQEEGEEFIAEIRRMRREDLERESPRFLRLRRPKMVLIK